MSLIYLINVAENNIPYNLWQNRHMKYFEYILSFVFLRYKLAIFVKVGREISLFIMFIICTFYRKSLEK